jgi:osmoprotectant transport system permease protein
VSDETRRPETGTKRGVDRVAATGALVALAGSVALPLFVLRANRIVAGVAQPLGAGGPASWALVAFALGGLAVALFAQGPVRARAELACAVGLLASLGWALGHAAVTLVPDVASSARVSIGAGAWLGVVGGATMWFAATRAPLGSWWRGGAAAALAASWVAAGLWDGLMRLSILREYTSQADAFWGMVATHVGLACAALAIATAIGVPLGIASARVPWVRAMSLSVAGLLQTIPSLALLGLLVLPLAALGLPGIGPLPAIIALTVYALLPIVRGTYLGLAHVDPAAVDAGLGMGMGRGQLLLRVEAPLALPLVIEGVRAAAIMSVGIAAVVAFVGVGTLGVLIIQGLGFQADDLILLGAVPMVVIAVTVDTALRAFGRLVTSPGIRVEAS